MKTICPGNCSGGNSTRQHPINSLLMERIPEDVQKRIAEESGSAYRCNYCGCVYLNGYPRKRILGHLDNGILGEGWH